MGNFKKNNGRVDQFLRELDAQGVLEPWQKEAIERALRKLRKAQRQQDPKEVMKATDEIARIFLRVSINAFVPKDETVV